MSTIITTQYLLPVYVVSNGQVTGNAWSDPDNILLVDDLLTESNPGQGVASDIIVGGYNASLPSTAIVTGLRMKLIAKRGALTVPGQTVTIYAVDNSSGTDVFYPYTAPVDSLTAELATYILGSQNYLFDQNSLTVDQVNNMQFQLIANGDIYVDSFLMEVFYYIPATPTPPAPVDGGCITCNSPIQVQAMFLELPFLSTDTKFYLQAGSFEYPDGTPVQPGDVGDCGGQIDLVFDEGVKKTPNTQNFEENVTLDLSSGYWTVLSSGVVEVSIGSLTNRGRMFHEPYTHDADLVSNHDANSKVVISNNGVFYSRFVRACQVGTVFSAPITVEDEGDEVVSGMQTLNFVGSSVQAEQDPDDSTKVNVTFLASPSNDAASVGSTSHGTVEAAATLTISHVITTENYLRVGISTDNQTISGVTYNGVALTLIAAVVNNPANLKVALYGLINPAAGTHDIVITMASSSHITGIGVAFDNVDTVSPTDGISAGAIGSSTVPSDSVTTISDNTVLMDMVGAVHNTTAFLQASPWTIRAQVDAASRPGAASTRKVLVPATVSDTYTMAPTGSWAIIIAGVRGATNPFASVNSVTGLDTDNSDPANPVIEIAVDGTSIGGAGTPGDPLHTIGASSGLSETMVADQDLTAGQPVGISNGEAGKKVALAMRGISTAALGYTPASVQSKNQQCPVGGEKFVLLNNISGTLYVSVGQIDQSTKTVTVGTKVTVTSGLLTGGVISWRICKLDTDKFIVVYTDNATPTVVRYRVGTISGTVITLGTAGVVATLGSNLLSIDLSQLGTDKGVVAVGAATAADSIVAAFTVASTTATIGTPVTPNSNVYATGLLSVAKVDTDKFILVSSNKYVQVGTVATVTITLGTQASFTATGVLNQAVVSPSTGVAVIRGNDSGPVENLIACTISGTTPTFGSEVLGAPTDSGGLMVLSSTALLTSKATGDDVVYKYTLSGTTLTYTGFLIELTASQAQQLLMLDSGIYLVLGINTTNLEVFVQGMSNNFMGIAKTTVLKGASVSVLYRGKDNLQTGLVPGGLYLVSAGALSLVSSSYSITTLSAPANNIQYVKALSATEIIL